jgi:hypothetical protein
MSTTRKKIREQVQIEYGRYLEKDGFNDNVDVRVIDLHVEQAINRLLKVQVLESVKRGNIEVPTCNIITYTLTPASNAVTLPVVPINLPLDMGIWSVALASAPETPFIPINNAFAMVYGGTNVAYLEGQIGYKVKGHVISFTSTVSATVDVDILVSDFSETSETDLLPVSPELEVEIIRSVLETLSSGTFAQAELNSIDNRRDAS